MDKIIRCSHDQYSSYPMVDLDSESDGDSDENTSSEDEINVILYGSMKQKERLRKRSLGQKSSSDDDFEKEMETELNKRMSYIENSHKGITKTSSQTKDASKKMKKECDPKRYEDEFLDSIDKSDDEECNQATSSQKHMSNDDLLYDPDMDDEDQKWVDKQRQQCRPQNLLNSLPGSRKSKVKGRKQATSDSTLSCPACMTCLCRDCQRHTVYKNQFRAMFVTNCTVDNTERLKYPIQGKNKKKKNKSSKQKNTTAVEGTSKEPVLSEESNALDETLPNVADKQCDTDMYYPVKCTSCSTEVGVYDKDEVYHFFNVIESNG